MMSDTHIAVFGAHAADAEIMAGGVAARYVNAGGSATFVHLTPGEKGHPVLGAEEYAGQKREEAVRAADAFGAGVRFLPRRDGELEFDSKTVDLVVDIIREVRPDLAITHWRGSFHPDHENTHHIVHRACFLAGLDAYRRSRPAHRVGAIYYAENWEDPYGFEQDLYIPIREEAYERWQEGVMAYELFSGDFADFEYMRYYRALFEVRGALSGSARAEAYMNNVYGMGETREWL